MEKRKMDIIQFSEIKRCALCGKPTTQRHATTEEYVHAQCARDYEQHWDEREKEMQYRARTGNDPRARLAPELEVSSITDVKGFNDIVEAMNNLVDRGAASGKCPTLDTRSVYSELRSMGIDSLSECDVKYALEGIMSLDAPAYPGL
jgi:hypothetical protein